MSFRYFLPTEILFGRGQLSQLAQHGLPGEKALIVISAGASMRRNGYLQRVTDQLDKAGVAHVVFDKILSNPIKQHVMEGAAMAKQEGCDFVIGLGGGSSIDSAKSIAVMATNPGDYWDYINGGSGKGQPVPCDPLPVVAITTTAGTGTEADPWTVITNGEEKIGFGNDKTFPVLSIVDPDLMLSVPPHLTAYQGFDALFHSTEGYLNKTANPISDLFALKAISLIGQSLAAAVADGSNADARADVALANTLSGMVETVSGCTSEHSLEHALSACHPALPHGAGLIAISLAYYTHFAGTGACDQRLVDMARALGRADAASPMDFVDALAALQKACGVDNIALSAYGVDVARAAEYARIARDTMGGLYEVDPAPLSDEAAIQIYERSFR